MTPAQGWSRIVARWLPALGWMALIFVLSSISGLRVSDDAAVDEPLRVAAHFFIYAVLGGLVLLGLTAWRQPGPATATLALVVALLYAATDELHQAFVPGRAAQIEDVFVDAVGAAVGIFIAWLIIDRRARRHAT